MDYTEQRHKIENALDSCGIGADVQQRLETTEKGDFMKCPKCGHQMAMGAPHSEGIAVQYECHNCGKIVTDPRERPLYQRLHIGSYLTDEQRRIDA